MHTVSKNLSRKKRHGLIDFFDIFWNNWNIDASIRLTRANQRRQKKCPDWGEGGWMGGRQSPSSTGRPPASGDSQSIRNSGCYSYHKSTIKTNGSI